MSNNKVILVALLVLVVLQDIDGKKVRRKRPQGEEQSAFPQPDVLTYSTFGFNDVGSYDGFVPSSPDYATLMTSNGGKEESTTRLYAPAFPTAMESSDFSSGFGSHYAEGQSFNTGSDGQQLGLFHLEPNTMNTFSFTNDPAPENRLSGLDSNSGLNKDKFNMPVYGAKINLKGKTKAYNDFAETSFKEFTTEPPTTYSNEKKYEKYYKSKKRYQSGDNKQTTTEPSSHQNVFYGIPNYPTPVIEPFTKTSYKNTSSLLNFPRVVDFTNLKSYYPNDLEGNYPLTNMKPLNANSAVADNNEFTKTTSFNDHDDKQFKVPSSVKNSVSYRDEVEKNVSKFRPSASKEEGFRNQFSDKFKGPLTTNSEYKDKAKTKPWNTSDSDLTSTNTNDVAFSSSKFINYNDDFNSPKNSMNGYQYSTNHSSTNFKFDYEEPKKQLNGNVDEVVPASSNIDLSEYQFPIDFTNFNKIPNFKTQNEEPDLSFNAQYQYKPSEEYLNRFKNLYTTTPTSSSNWGNIFKSTEYTFNKNHKRRPQYGEENINNEIVHIPKRPQSHKYGINEIKSIDSPSDFPFHSGYRPYKPQRPQYDWNTELSNTRFKSEEDLLGLRNRETLRPSYLPTFSATPTEVPDEHNYKRLIEQWRLDYLRAKQKEAFQDYESYASDTKPIHVPVPKPYPIEVPHPVIVPVPQPYPVRVPVPKPVAVPVIRELMVPIEKPVPYPVVRKVPYPIEKPVPVPVEKQVTVPVVKPYPVPVPQIRPVFHHSKHSDDANNLDEDDDDYVPRPESSKRVPYAKRPKSSRNRQRRPSRTAFPERSRRRWPQQQSVEGKERRYSKRPRPSSIESSFPRYRHRDREHEEFENQDRSYVTYCKKTGNC